MSGLGYIFDIKKFSINDGPGIRTTVFFKGCPLNCQWCHNPESRNMKPEKISSESYNWSIYSLSCSPDVIGRLMSVEQVMDEIKKDIPFYEESGGGVTFSGGEPLLQLDFLLDLLKECKALGITTAVDTSGYTQYSNIEKIFDLTDLFLYDFKIFDDILHKRFTGVSNTLIIENLRRLTESGNKVIVRIPLIPGVNDSEENISTCINYFRHLNIRQINILPFHNSASAKYKRLGLEYNFQNYKTQGIEELETYRVRFSETGIPVTIGG